MEHSPDNAHNKKLINLNIDRLNDMMNVAVRRVSAFIHLGLDGAEERVRNDFSLESGITYKFWPDAISEEDRIELIIEYRSWLLGMALRELDAMYSLFLDNIWLALEAAELNGNIVAKGFEFDNKFKKKTNVAEKQRLVCEKLEIDGNIDEFKSLSLARNALAHNSGIIRKPIDCNDLSRGTLILRWLTFQMIVLRDGNERIVERTPFDIHELPGNGEIFVSIRYVQRQIQIKSGQRILLTHEQIAELCMFYKIEADKLISKLLDKLRSSGILVPSE